MWHPQVGKAGGLKCVRNTIQLCWKVMLPSRYSAQHGGVAACTFTGLDCLAHSANKQFHVSAMKAAVAGCSMDIIFTCPIFLVLSIVEHCLPCVTRRTRREAGIQRNLAPHWTLKLGEWA